MRFYIILLVIVLFTACAKDTSVTWVSGPTGAAGATGVSGHSAVFSSVTASASQCTNGGNVLLVATDSNDNGVLDSDDTNIQSLTVCNGVNATGLFSKVSVVAPCGADSSPHKEVLLFLSDCSLMASFSDSVSGQNTRFALLSDGNYIDTDSSGCQFNVTTSGNTKTVSWNAGSNSYATWVSGSQSCTQ